MANTNETITDIIKGIRAEADYIEETARGSLKAGENYDGIVFTELDLESALDCAETKRKEADRLEAAHERDADALKQRCTELNAEIAAKDEVIKRLNDALAEEQRRKMTNAENPSAVGDAAKLREAVAYLFTLIDMRKLVLDCDETEEISAVQVMLDECRAALAAPPRNCDMGTAEELGKPEETK